MNQTSKWICKISSLQEFTRAEQSDLSVTVSELDRIESDKGVEYDALHFDLQELVDCYSEGQNRCNVFGVVTNHLITQQVIILSV